ncbi:zinc ribbon domain-containing protein [Paenibacillus sp. SC116]|uniref:zinc ribbon domain-containing protein n=1 Tax=Paenibacillus sp. SC116 TaxID=2968986 RepID=UPI00215A8097|nr:zinc ribbon domain-containing protein [Paenibacillus sp. SC116]MCR8845137.1 zinc ribbon domain-containing protein [Paenibacillus sp. SC116]
MNRFLKKVKEGASKASEKAQNVLELNRVQSQIDALRKEWEHNTYEIGRLAFEAYKNQDYASLGIEMDELAQANVILEEEMERLEWKRCALRNEKRCSCGEIAPWSSKFCASCGDRLPDPPVREVEIEVDSMNDAQHYKLENEADHKAEEKENTYITLQQTPTSIAFDDANERDDEVESLSRYAKAAKDSTSPNQPYSPYNQYGQEDEDDADIMEIKKPTPQVNIRGSERYIRQQPVEHDPNSRTCSKCSAAAPLEAKWCERCGAPFI